MKAFNFGTALSGLLLAGGCGMEGPVPSDTKPAPAAAAPQVPANTAGNKAVAGTKPVEPTPTAAATTTTAPEPKPGMVREKAHVGMGEKGRGYGTGLLAVTLKSYWNAKEMLALNEIKHSMELYKASEGHYPKTQEEFMQKIIKDGNIKLPVLPPDHRYVYDPTCEEFLMIEAPQMGNDPP